MSPDPKVKLLFGDILASGAPTLDPSDGQRLDALGFGDYRRSDPLVMRFTAKRGSGARGHGVTARLTRQGREVVSGLVEAWLPRVFRQRDSRRRIVELTPRGREYLSPRWWPLFARLNDEVTAGARREQLVAAYAVLNRQGPDRRGRTRDPRARETNDEVR